MSLEVHVGPVCVYSILYLTMSLAFQWLQELKEKRAQARAALGVRRSPRSHSIKVFYGKSTASEEEKKEASRPTGSPKKRLCSPSKKPKLGSPLKKQNVLCLLILY